MKKPANQDRRLRFEGLENRNLLSADFGVQMAEVAPPADQAAAIVSCQPAEAIQAAAPEVQPMVLESELKQTGSTNQAADSSLSQGQEPVVLETVPGEGRQLPGFFGRLDTENPSQSFRYEASESGTVKLAIAGAFEEGAVVEVVDQAGDLVSRSRLDSLEGFLELEFSAEAEESFDIRVAAENPSNDPFMVTVDFEADPIPVDLHADQIGGQSTEMDLECGPCEVQGEVGRDGDVDTFQFQPPADGKVDLQISSGDPSAAVSVKVIDGTGNLVARGRTGQSIDFQPTVRQDQTYYVVVESAGSNPATYDLRIDPGPAVEATQQSIPDNMIVMDQGQFEVEAAIDADEGTRQFQLQVPESGALEIDFLTNTTPGELTISNSDGEVLGQGLTADSLLVKFPTLADQMLTLEVRSPSGDSLDFRMEGRISSGTTDSPVNRQDRQIASRMNQFMQTERSVLDSLFSDPMFTKSFSS